MTDPAAHRRRFDALRVRVEPGERIVVRLPGLLAIIESPSVGDRTNELLEVLHTAAAAPRALPGPVLSRRLADWLADIDDAPSFGTAAATEGGLALFLYGDAHAVVDAGMKPGISGREAASAVDRVLPWPASTLRLTIGEPAPVAPLAGLPGWAGLQAGVTVGGALTLEVDRVSAPDPSVAPSSSGSAAGPGPYGRPREPVREPLISERIHGAGPADRREPLPIAGAAPQQSLQQRHREALTHAKERPGAYVRGFRCSRGHLNDPRVSFCGVCGIRMDQLTGVLVFERRPPLGLFVLDVGTTFVLDDNYIIGRNPDVSEVVRDGSHRPIRIDDRSGSTSRVHSEVRLVDWDVLLVDLGSANGTYIAGAEAATTGGEPRWTRLVPHRPFALTPGTHVLIGRRRFVFESASARV